MKKILVTGGTGYIGSHTVVELIQEGYEIVIVDNLCNSDAEVVNRIREITGVDPVFEKMDLCEYDKVLKLFKTYSFDAIIHFAALKAVGESVSQPLEYYHNNIQSLVNLLRAMPGKQPPALVFSSSCTVYGQPDSLPVTEQAPVQKAMSPYGNTKQISEEILYDTLKSNPLFRIISLRYFNPIGAHRSALIGELPKGIPLNLVPFITQTAAGVREKLFVFGNDYNTPDGTAIRDYIDIIDLAKAHVKALKRLLDGKNKNAFEVFNLGTGHGISVMEMITTFEKVTGQKIPYKIVSRRSGDIEKVWADSSLANKELEWKALTPLSETLKSAWEWEKRIQSIIK